MQATFFATDVDLLKVVQWFLEVPGMTLFEAASRPDLPNRQFCTVEEVEQSFREPGRNKAAWLASTGARPRLRRIQFEPSTQRRLGAKGRTELASPSMIRISRDTDQNGSLGAAHISCWNEKGARQRSMYAGDVLDQVDWKALRSITGSVQRKLSKASPGKLRSYPIMEDAFSELREGRLSRWNWGAACSYPSPHITLSQAFSPPKPVVRCLC
jgi:hypothetical protein